MINQPQAKPTDAKQVKQELSMRQKQQQIRRLNQAGQIQQNRHMKKRHNSVVGNAVKNKSKKWLYAALVSGSTGAGAGLGFLSTLT